MSKSTKTTTITHSKHAYVCGAVMAVAIVAAVVLGALYAFARVPDNAAAKLNDAYITEEEVASYINASRIASATTDDAQFATYLSQQGMTVAEYRIKCIENIATSKLIDQQAQEDGVSIDSSEVDSQISTYKQNLSMGDDSIWQSTLEQQGMTEETLRAQIETNLREQALYEKNVTPRVATDDQATSYMQSSLSGQELKHCYRIVFTGDGQWDRAQTAYKELQKSGKMTAESFAVIAEKYAAEDSTELTQGSYLWNDSSEMSENVSDALDDLKAGEYCSPTTIDADDATEIIFCDVDYTFPTSDDLNSLELSSLDSTLADHVRELTTDALWTTDCASYKAWLLARAQVTYYAVPQSAVYNVDMSKAGTSSTSDDEGESSGSGE